MKAKYLALALIIIILLLGGIAVSKLLIGQNNDNNYKVSSSINSMKITSEDFQNGQLLPRKFTCDGNGSSPALEFSDIPKVAESLALIYEDPDAPRSFYAPDGVWVHWLVWNISPSKNTINEGERNLGITGKNSSGKDYDIPCPPNGEHRYIFKLYALDAMLDLPPGSAKSELLESMRGHILAEAELLSRYGRQ